MSSGNRWGLPLQRGLLVKSTLAIGVNLKRDWGKQSDCIGDSFLGESAREFFRFDLRAFLADKKRGRPELPGEGKLFCADSFRAFFIN
ncbi:MAG: hypothetical protein GXO76_09380 [Calditrichaeota bacterium]|nr:hypothetical protein [Calditrichota bacterium]